jgi:hypothetical protein
VAAIWRPDIPVVRKEKAAMSSSNRTVRRLVNAATAVAWVGAWGVPYLAATLAGSHGVWTGFQVIVAVATGVLVATAAGLRLAAFVLDVRADLAGADALVAQLSDDTVRVAAPTA